MSAITPITSMMRRALVFDGEGCCHQSASALCKQLQSLLDPSIAVEKVTSAVLSKKKWMKNTVVFAIGGGTCSEWDKSLDPKALCNIREYAKVGRILTFCAGSYFTSASSSFTLLDKPALEKERGLALFPGKAIGPIFPTSAPLSSKEGRAVEVACKIDETVKKGYLYYQGGCHFQIPKEMPHIKVVAECNDLPVGVICSYGKQIDNILVCGLHPEFSWPKNLKTAPHPDIAKLAETLCDQEEFRQNFWNGIGKKMNLPIRQKL